MSRLASLDSGSKFGRFELTPLAESLLREVWGRLALDENDTVIFLPIPAGRLTEGANTLTISQTGRVADDIRVGEIILDLTPPARRGSARCAAVIEESQHEVPT